MGAYRRWWLEWELWVLVLLVGVIHMSRLTATVIRGEEAHRGQVAQEMLASGDWIVPRLQGDLFLSRPPVQNWAIALVDAIHGQADELPVRLPSAMAVLLTVILIYGYGRTFLTPLGAAVAGAAYATMGHMLQLAQLGETEAIYALELGGALLCWHWADTSGKRPLLSWCVGYALAAAGMLTKGPQAPVYFASAVAAFLLLEGRGRELLRRQHWAGVAVFLTIWAAWQIPFSLRVGPYNTWTILSGDIAMRVNHHSWAAFFNHLATFPLEVFGCMLPWSVLLLPFLWPAFRRGVGPAAGHVRFLACVVAVTFPTCWLVTAARNRYFVAIYPCIVPLMGLAVDRCCQAAAPAARSAMWRHLLGGVGLVMPFLGLWVVAATVLGLGPQFGAQPPWFAAVCLVSGVALGATALVAARRPHATWNYVGLLAMVAFLGLLHTGVVTNVLADIGEPIRKNVLELKQRLPPGTQLVSLGTIEPNFAYYYGEPIRQIPRKQLAAHLQEDWEYFCIGCDENDPKCDFPHEVVARIKCWPLPSPDRKAVVLIGRRLGVGLVGLRPGVGVVR
jgi:4-amino-4-deoxy-L-arabinose transferase-like glycosyltransferase